MWMLLADMLDRGDGPDPAVRPLRTRRHCHFVLGGGVRAASDRAAGGVRPQMLVDAVRCTG
jgi:hypothetical protein